MKVRGTPISDLADLGIDSYVLGAKNDHLCIWQSVYRSAQTARRPKPLRARQQRPHPDHRLPAGKSEGQLLHQ